MTDDDAEKRARYEQRRDELIVLANRIAARRPSLLTTPDTIDEVCSAIARRDIYGPE